MKTQRHIMDSRVLRLKCQMYQRAGEAQDRHLKSLEWSDEVPADAPMPLQK
jgi:hypothetical protein